jgi:hypothetical protein
MKLKVREGNKKMKIESKKLEKFLRNVRMSTITQVLLNFSDKGLEVSAMSPAASNMVSALLKKEKFIDYAAIGKIGVDQLETLINIIKNFKEIEFELKTNTLTFKGDSKSVEFEIVDEKYIDPVNIKSEFEHTTNFKITGQKVLDFMSDISINKDTAVIIKTVENGVMFTNDGKYKFKYNHDNMGTVAGVNVKFGAPFFETLSNIDKDTELLISVKDDYPMTVKFDSDDFNILFVIAPRIETEQ